MNAECGTNILDDSETGNPDTIDDEDYDTAQVKLDAYKASGSETDNQEAVVYIMTHLVNKMSDAPDNAQVLIEHMVKEFRDREMYAISGW